MKIQINTDNHLLGRETLAHQAEATVKSALGHLTAHTLARSRAARSSRPGLAVSETISS